MKNDNQRTAKSALSFPILAFIASLTLLAFLSTCSTKHPSQYKKDGVTLRPQSKLKMSTGGVDVMKLDHPAIVSEEIIRHHLLSLRYQEMTLFGEKKRLYEPEEVAQLAPLIVKGLGKVSKKSVLFHQFDGKHGLVAGEVFHSGDVIHWRFQTVAGIDFANHSMRVSSGRKGQSTFWKMVPRKGQSYYKSKKAGLGTTWENWIVSKIETPRIKLKNRNQTKMNALKNRLSRKPRSTEVTKEQVFQTITKELERKLQTLKKLREQDLISETEYIRKHKELLDQYL
tara:strand:+ start:36 stop:887 length:852 start_codon:yes stop_codon:yes gene_type:complete